MGFLSSIHSTIFLMHLRMSNAVSTRRAAIHNIALPWAVFTHREAYLTHKIGVKYNSKLVRPEPSNVHPPYRLHTKVNPDTRYNERRIIHTENIASMTRRVRMCVCASKLSGLASPSPSHTRFSAAWTEGFDVSIRISVSVCTRDVLVPSRSFCSSTEATVVAVARLVLPPSLWSSAKVASSSEGHHDLLMLLKGKRTTREANRCGGAGGEAYSFCCLPYCNILTINANPFGDAFNVWALITLYLPLNT